MPMNDKPVCQGCRSPDFLASWPGSKAHGGPDATFLHCGLCGWDQEPEPRPARTPQAEKDAYLAHPLLHKLITGEGA